MPKRNAPKYGPLTTSLFKLADKFRASGHASVVHLQAGKSGSISVKRKPGSIHHQVYRSQLKSRWKRVVVFHIDNGP